MTTPRASFVVVTRNSEAMLGRCLGKLAEAAAAVPLEVIVADNGSSDGTAAMVRERHPGARLLGLGRNLGFAAAVNRGAALASAPVLCLLNDDAWLDAATLTAMLGILDAESAVGVLGGQLVYPDGRCQHSVAAVPTLATELLNKSLLRILGLAPVPPRRIAGEGLLDVPSLIGACLFTRTDLFRDLGGLDESYFFYLEETDYCLRARAAGRRVCAAPALRVVHDQGHSSRRVRAEAKIEYARSLFVFFRKHRGPATAALLRAGLSAEQAVKFLGLGLLCAASLGLRRRWREQLRAHALHLAWALRGWPERAGLKGLP